MAIRTGSVTVKPKLRGAVKSSSAPYNPDNLLEGHSGEIRVSFGDGAVFYYGFDLSVLSTLDKVSIVGVTVTTSAKKYSSSAATLTINMVTDFPSSGSSSSAVSNYTDLGDGGIDVEVSGSYTTVAKDESYMPKALAWMNANLDKVIAGLSSPTFGIRLGLAKAYVNLLTLTVTYSYDDGLASSNIIGDTVQVKSVLLSKQEVKEVYINKTKVYG